jgi:sugar porter (SP) family MFS transporter
MGVMNLNINWKQHKWAIFYCLVSTIGALCYGYDTIYYTGIQGMKVFIHNYGYQKADGQYALTTSFLSVTASVIYVGEFCGAMITAPINDRWGRRAVFLTASICIICGVIVQVCSDGIYSVFCVGRIFIGLGIGQFTATCLVYIGEVAPAEIRGPALMMFQFMQSWSQFIGACINEGTEGINSAASYRIPMGLLIVLPAAMLLCLPFIPESPVWYIYKGKHDQAEQSLRKINRYPGYEPEYDLHTIEEQVRMEQEMSSQSSWSSLLMDPVERRKLIFSCGAMFAQQVNGIQFWYTYGVIFAQSIGVAQPFTINTIIYIVQILAVGMSVLFGNKLRRRVNLLVCTIGMIVSLIAVGCLGTTHRGGPFSRGVGIAIVVFAFFNVVFFNFSIGTLSYTMASEMAVGRNRNKITASAIGVFFLTVWLMVFIAPYLYYSANLGPMIGFFYAATALLGTLTYVWFCVGETTGRTNTDIDRLFMERVPVRKWRTYVFAETQESELKTGEKGTFAQEVEVEVKV